MNTFVLKKYPFTRMKKVYIICFETLPLLLYYMFDDTV